MAKVGEIQARFERNVEEDAQSGCHIWTGYKNNRGYGVISLQYRGKEKKMYAHRLAYQGYVGWIPEGMHVLHRCDNPSCVNVDHLFIGTNEDNMRDMVSKGRSVRGERQHLSKLTAAEVLEARDLYHNQGFLVKDIVSRYSVEQSTLWDAIVGNTWKHI